MDPYSAGLEKHGVNPHGVEVMGESGVDLSNQILKTLDDLKGVRFTYAVTVCSPVVERTGWHASLLVGIGRGMVVFDLLSGANEPSVMVILAAARRSGPEERVR